MTTCVSGIKACRARIVRLDECGRPVVGPKSVASFKGFVSIGLSPDIEEGEEFLQKDACGDFCINEKDCDRLKRIGLDMQFCVLDPDIIEVMTGSPLLLDPQGDAKGVAIGEDIQCDGGFSLEVWQKIAGSTCSTTGDPLWLYWALPFITNGTIGDLTFENGPFVFNITAQTKKISQDDQWGADNRGPFQVLPASAPLPNGTHLAPWITDVQPPESACGTVPLAA